MSIIVGVVVIVGLLVYGIWLMVVEGREKRKVLSSLNGQTVNIGIGRGAYAGGNACRGRIVFADSQRSVTFVEEEPDFQKGAFGLRDPRRGEGLRLGQIRWIATTEGKVVGGPWTKLRVPRRDRHRGTG